MQAPPRAHSEPLAPLLAMEHARSGTFDRSPLRGDSVSVRYEDLQLMRLLLDDGNYEGRDEGRNKGQALAAGTGVEKEGGIGCVIEVLEDEGGGAHSQQELSEGSAYSHQIPSSESRDGCGKNISTGSGGDGTRDGDGGDGIHDGFQDLGPEFGGSTKDDPMLQMHEIQQKLLLSFRQEAMERMILHSMLQRVFTFEIEVRMKVGRLIREGFEYLCHNILEEPFGAFVRQQSSCIIF